MKIKYDCIPCLSKQFITLAERLSEDESIREKIVSYGLDCLRNNRTTQTPPYITGRVYAYARALTGIDDPYEEEKVLYNSIANQLIDEMKLKERILMSPDSFDTAVRLSIAGNIIDFSLGYDVDKALVQESVTLSLKAPLIGSTIQDFKSAINNANKILFLGDNSGEIVFDQLLISLLPKSKTTYVVKGGPIVNDATMEDAKAVNMSSLVPVVSTGSLIQGTLLSDCDEAFIELFNEADLIISKGQANFETLNHLTDKSIFFLLRAKCLSIAKEIGCEQNDFVMKSRK